MNPITQWNADLQQARADMEMKQKWESRLERIDTDLIMAHRTVEDSLQTLQKEEKDVEQLVTSSFAQFWLGLFGKLDDKLTAEEKQAAEAKLKYDAAQASLQLLEKERAEIASLLGDVLHAGSKLEDLKKGKESWIRDHDLAKKEELEAISDQIGRAKAQLVEIKEAESAGARARDALARAEDRLGSAKNWGTYDMIGGGMISTMIKHGRIDEARDHIHEAQHHLRRFAEELKDLKMDAEASAPQIGGFLTFADYFFDGLISDWMVQGRIKDSIESVTSNQDKVNETLQKLSRMKRKLEQEISALRSRCDDLIERYGT